ncbi:MAG: energy transducer TonB [Bryobacteraceae bacterium]|nr:energy transducer TonB [Bryobacteraceae bacterium]
MKTVCLLALVTLSFAVTEGRAIVKVPPPEAFKAAIEQPKPEYNPIAKRLRVGGEVVVEASVDETGAVTDVKVVSGNALLSQTVVKAVKDWKFTPFKENGAPSPAVATLKFTFKAE